MAAPGSAHHARQLAEHDLLISMYPTECKRCDSSSDEDLQCTLELQPSYTLEISLPEQYPETAAPVTYLHCGDRVSTADRKLARGKLAEITANSWSEQEGECLDVLVESFVEWVRQFRSTLSIKDGEQEDNSHASTNGVSAVTIAEKSPRLENTTSHGPNSQSTHASDHRIKRVLLWSHHLLATSKRKDILKWSRELHLGGFSRPGYPGAIFVEGDSDRVSEFVTRIKELRWQALQVRADQSAERRIFGDGVDGVVEVESLGEVVERLKRLDESVAEMFLEGMKIGR